MCGPLFNSLGAVPGKCGYLLKSRFGLIELPAEFENKHCTLPFGHSIDFETASVVKTHTCGENPAV